jgi:hypothetical protein
MAPDNKDNKDKKDKPVKADRNEKAAKAPTIDDLTRLYADLSTRVAGVRRGL